MDSFMLFQVRSWSKSFVTFIACIRLISRMNALMSDQVANLSRLIGLWKLTWEKDLPHPSKSQTYGWRLSCTLLCFCNEEYCTNVDWHSWLYPIIIQTDKYYHSNGLSPVCLLKCSLRVLLHEKNLPQSFTGHSWLPKESCDDSWYWWGGCWCI